MQVEKRRRRSNSYQPIIKDRLLCPVAVCSVEAGVDKRDPLESFEDCCLGRGGFCLRRIVSSSMLARFSLAFTGGCSSCFCGLLAGY